MSEAEFAAQVTELKRLGLNAASLGQIVQAGPDQVLRKRRDTWT